MSRTSAVARRQARRALDGRLLNLRPVVGQFSTPNGGWVRAIREALGMSAEQLANRMNVSTTSIRSLEANERAGRVQLDTLRRAADALNCDLVYALVPRTPLEEQVRAQAVEKVLPAMARVEHTMALEDQLPDAIGREWLLEDALESVLDRAGLWDAD